MIVHYIVCTIRPWNAEAFRRRAPTLGGTWHMIDDPAHLTVEVLAGLSPRNVFFRTGRGACPMKFCRGTNASVFI